jgi:hypothetical protein
MNDQHMKHIEQLSEDIAWHRRTLAEKEWLRHEFVKLDDKRRPARAAVQRWVHNVKRAIAFWLLT